MNVAKEEANYRLSASLAHGHMRASSTETRLGGAQMIRTLAVFYDAFKRSPCGVA